MGSFFFLGEFFCLDVKLVFINDLCADLCAEFSSDRRCVTKFITDIVWQNLLQTLCDKLYYRHCVTKFITGIVWQKTKELSLTEFSLDSIVCSFLSFESLNVGNSCVQRRLDRFGVVSWIFLMNLEQNWRTILVQRKIVEYVCLYIYIYIYTHTYIYIYTYIHIHRVRVFFEEQS